MSIISSDTQDLLLSALGTPEARNELINAIETGSNSLSNVIAGTNITTSLVNGELTINAGDIDPPGVSSFNALTGVVTISAGANVTLTPSGNNISIAASGSSGATTTLNNLTSPTAINQDLNLGTHQIKGMGNPSLAQDAATKAYVDAAIPAVPSILVFASTATVGGAASEAVAVTGLLSTDTILSVSQKTGGGAALPILGWSTQANNLITVIYSADMGSGAVVLVAVKR
jgi:hypothetical protein